jgi:hypothetical protein
MPDNTPKKLSAEEIDDMLKRIEDTIPFTSSGLRRHIAALELEIENQAKRIAEMEKR